MGTCVDTVLCDKIDTLNNSMTTLISLLQGWDFTNTMMIVNDNIKIISAGIFLLLLYGFLRFLYKMFFQF